VAKKLAPLQFWVCSFNFLHQPAEQTDREFILRPGAVFSNAGCNEQVFSPKQILKRKLAHIHKC